MDGFPYCELYLQNDGTAFDEDIEIKLCLENGSLLKTEDFPIPEVDINDINEADILKEWICPPVTADIEEFDYFTAEFTQPYIPQLPVGLLHKIDDKAELEHEREKYIDRLKYFFDWEVFKEDNNEILKISIRKLNQFRTMNLPARLFFDVVPTKISYSIKAKHTPHIISGEIQTK